MIGWGRVLARPALVSGLTALAVSVATGIGGPVGVAQAADPVIAFVTAYGAPDGVFVQWDAPDQMLRMWRVTRTVGDVVTTRDVWGVNYTDRELSPGQEATYTVAAHDGSTTWPDSAPATAARGAQDWSAPQGARTISVRGPVAPAPASILPYSSDTMTFGTDERASFVVDGISVGRLPGPGTYDLVTSPGPGQVWFRTYCPSGAPSGHIDVYDVVYGASGTPLELGADVSWRCGDGETRVDMIRFNSAAPVAHVIVEPPVEAPNFVRGQTVTPTWRLHNIGDAAATIGTVTGAVSAWDAAAPISADCDGVSLQPGDSCAVTMTLTLPSDTEPGARTAQLYATVQDQPAAAGLRTYTVYHELVPPTLTWVGRTVNGVGLQWDLAPSQMQPLAHLLVERRVDGGSWAEVARAPADSGSWTDWSVRPGMNVAYRVSTVATDGETSGASAVVSGDVPDSSLVWANVVGIAGGGSPADPEAVSFALESSNLTTGVAVSPDRTHLGVATYHDPTNTATLSLTDLTGRNPRVLATSSSGSDFRHLLFSPDGKRIAYVNLHGFSGVVAVLDLTSGDSQQLQNQGIPYGWSPDGSSLLMAGGISPTGERLTGLRWVRVADDTWTAVPGTSSIPNDDGTTATSATVSRTGEIVWLAPTPSGGRQLMRVPAGGGAVATLWAPAGCNLSEPQFSPSGGEVSVGIGGPTCVPGTSGTVALKVPTTGEATQWRRFLALAPMTTAWLTSTSAAPTATASVPPVTGASAPVQLTGSDPDDRVGGLAYSCRLDGGAWQGCGRTWQLTGLTAGPHTVSAMATDPSGARSPAASVSWTVDRTPPSVSVAAPPGAVLGSSLTLSWSATDTGGSSVASYDVRERYASPAGGFSGYVYPSTWQGRTATTLPLRLSQGYNYCFAVRARDRVGNVGSFSAERCTTAVMDDRALANHGGLRGTSTAYAFGTWTRLASSSQYVSRSGVRARRLGLTVATCSSCGAVDLWIGSVKWGRVNTYSSTTRYRQTLWLPWAASRYGTVVMRPASTRRVYVDGLVIQK